MRPQSEWEDVEVQFLLGRAKNGHMADQWERETPTGARLPHKIHTAKHKTRRSRHEE